MQRVPGGEKVSIVDCLENGRETNVVVIIDLGVLGYGSSSLHNADGLVIVALQRRTSARSLEKSFKKRRTHVEVPFLPIHTKPPPNLRPV